MFWKEQYRYTELFLETIFKSYYFLPIALKVLTREPLQDATKHFASNTLALEHSNRLAWPYIGRGKI